RDLQTICLKCLQKEPHKRYASALDLADDLGRFLQAKPIHARPVSLWEQSLKWAWRHPSAAGLLGVSVSAVVALLTVVLISNARLQTERDRAREQEQDAREQRARAVRELVRFHVTSGAQAASEDDLGLALGSYLDALKLDQEDPEREE